MAGLLGATLLWGLWIFIALIVFSCLFFIFWFSLHSFRIWRAKKKNKSLLQEKLKDLKQIEKEVKNAREEYYTKLNKRLDELEKTGNAVKSGEPAIKEPVTTGTVGENPAKREDVNRNIDAVGNINSEPADNIKPVVRNNKRDRKLPEPPTL